ncbi:MAG: hypothetical protein U0X91_07605 [Spirosomataceae bacterium]
MTLLQQTNHHILAQLRDLISRISYEAYSSPLALLHGSSVGQHIRHTLEFYQCLSEQAPLGFVDYDARNRNLRLETDLVFSASVVGQLATWLSQPVEDTYLSMKVFFGEESQEIPTTLTRELVYLAEHAIHHFAIIKIALEDTFPDIVLSSDFGVAFSTIKYRESLQEQ